MYLMSGSEKSIKRRYDNLELLRIIAMILITFNHITSLGNTLTDVMDGSTVISLFYLLGGKFGCNVFVILGSWFLTDSEFKMSRIISIWLQTFIYQLVLYGIDVIIFHVEPTFIETIRNISVLTSHYWYPRAYICMMLAAPIIKKIYRCLNKKLASLIIVWGGILLSIVPTVTFEGALVNGVFLKILMKIICFEPIWFCYMFALVFYVKKYLKIEQINPKYCIVFFFICYIMMFLIETVLYYYGVNGMKINKVPMSEIYFKIRNLQSVPCVIAAFSLFFLFKSFRINSKWIGNVSGVFGVYLLQCHAASQTIIWSHLFPLLKWRNEGIIRFLIFSVFTVSVIMLVGIISEWIYKSKIFHVFENVLIVQKNNRKE